MKINIAIDGPAGSGKGTTAKILAKKLEYIYLDSGAIYRALTYYFTSKNISYTNHEKIIEEFSNIKINFNPKNDHILLNNEDIEKEIRSKEIADLVSYYATKSTNKIRNFVTKISKEIIKNKGVVLEGRDATTVLDPNAELKIYLDADLEKRAERRFEQIKDNQNITYNEVLKNLKERDELDKKNIINAKKIGILVDTSNITIEKQVSIIKKLVDDILNKKNSK